MRVLLVGTLACASGKGGPADASGTDGARVDVEAADGASPDGAPPDGGSTSKDAENPDGVVLDAPPGDEPSPEKICGERDKYFSVYTATQAAALADCTVLLGFFQEDSVADLVDLAFLSHVTRVEGNINIFRSPGFLTLHGLENLEEVRGNLYIHLNPNLTSIAALAKLRTVTGNVLIRGNTVLPQAEVEAFGARVTVGGTKTLELQSIAP